ncbi:MAG: leucine-rich repeat domain-containing protein [Bacteroidetes bacterium]|nr:leucine-rich repeat domain-containing protein [Bacteroidota bacterium]
MYVARNLEDALQAPLETGELFLSGRGLTDFPTEIFQLVNLKVLDLSQNLLRQLPAQIGYLSQLQTLNLRNNQLRQIPAEIGQLMHLQRLDLDENQLAELPQELTECQSIRTLQLNDNSFRHWPANALHPQLENLTLGLNQLLEVPESIRHLTRLKYLDLRSNRLQHLPVALALLDEMEQIQLKGNPLHLTVNASDPEGLLERFFREMKLAKTGRKPSKYTQQTRRCWLQLLKAIPKSLNLMALQNAPPPWTARWRWCGRLRRPFCHKSCLHQFPRPARIRSCSPANFRQFRRPRAKGPCNPLDLRS